MNSSMNVIESIEVTDNSINNNNSKTLRYVYKSKKPIKTFYVENLSTEEKEFIDDNHSFYSNMIPHFFKKYQVVLRNHYQHHKYYW